MIIVPHSLKIYIPPANDDFVLMASLTNICNWWELGTCGFIPNPEQNRDCYHYLHFKLVELVSVQVMRNSLARQLSDVSLFLL